MSEPLHHSGVWWARTPDGAVLRFNEELDGWEPWSPHSLGPPPPSQWRELIAQPPEPSHDFHQEAPPPPPPPAATDEPATASPDTGSNVSQLRREEGQPEIRADLIAERIVAPEEDKTVAPAPPEPAPEAAASADARATKECPACAETVGELAAICRFCGYDFLAATIPMHRTGFAVAGFVFGIVGFLIPLIGTVFALVFGYTAKGQIQSVPQRYAGRLATAAIILGWTQLLVWATAVSLWRYL